VAIDLPYRRKAVRTLTNKIGCYVLCDLDNVPIYVGQSVDGIRARVRHPVYLAHFCEMLAWSVATGLAVCWGLTALATIAGVVMIRMEDAELEKRFGDTYRSYRIRVPAIIPRVSRPVQL